MKTGDTGVIPTAMSVLAELDQTQAELQSEFPGWRIWYVYRPGNVSWAARPEPVLNTQSAEDLRAAIAKVLANDGGDPLVSDQGGYDDPEDTLDLLSVIADEGTGRLVGWSRSAGRPAQLELRPVREYSVARGCLRMR